MQPTCLTHFRKIGKRKLRGRTPNAALAIHQGRIRARQAREIEDARPRFRGWIKHIIPLGAHTIPVLAYTRAKNWTTSRPHIKRSYESKDDQGRYSNSCTFTKYAYTQHIQSWGIVVARRLRTTIDTGEGVKTTLLRPWRGWHWTIDQYGICLVDTHGQRDYHPTATDLLEWPTTRQIAVIARERDAQRREIARTEREELAGLRRAEREGARVCVADSVHAGNCHAGTLAWAERHGLNATQHYRPSAILAAANGDVDRVTLVVALALKRHRKEMRAGFCELARHRV